MMKFPSVRLFIVSALLALLLAVPSLCNAQTFTANYASDQGPFLRRGQSYLYSWWHGRESPMHGNLELKPNSWRIGYVRMSAAQLAALDTNAVYTLDVIDARNNTWGWFNFDSARIPGVLVLPPGPTLTIQIWPGNQVRIAWPASATGYRVQVKLALADAWEDAEAGWGFIPVTEGSESVIYVPDWEDAQFFRLEKP